MGCCRVGVIAQWHDEMIILMQMEGGQGIHVRYDTIHDNHVRPFSVSGVKGKTGMDI